MENIGGLFWPKKGRSRGTSERALQDPVAAFGFTRQQFRDICIGDSFLNALFQLSSNFSLPQRAPAPSGGNLRTFPPSSRGKPRSATAATTCRIVVAGSPTPAQPSITAIIDGRRGALELFADGREVSVDRK